MIDNIFDEKRTTKQNESRYPGGITQLASHGYWKNAIKKQGPLYPLEAVCILECIHSSFWYGIYQILHNIYYESSHLRLCTILFALGVEPIIAITPEGLCVERKFGWLLGQSKMTNINSPRHKSSFAIKCLIKFLVKYNRQNKSSTG